MGDWNIYRLVQIPNGGEAYQKLNDDPIVADSRKLARESFAATQDPTGEVLYIASTDAMHPMRVQETKTYQAVDASA